MSRSFTATLLMRRTLRTGVDAVADSLKSSFPGIGSVDVRPSVGPDEIGVIVIDGAPVTLAARRAPLPPESLSPPLRLMRDWDPEPAIRAHMAHLDVTCGGDLLGLEAAEAYAAAVHFVAAAVCQTARVNAVFWHEGWNLSQPDAFARSAATLLGGRMPIERWVSFATVVPRGFRPEDAIGMVTYGMRPFIGHELELAPRPGDAQSAWACVSSIARLALDRGVKLADGRRLTDAGGRFAVTVRERRFWLRRDLSAYVLVADDSMIDPKTLKPRNRPAA